VTYPDCDPELRLFALAGIPLVAPGDDLATLIAHAWLRSGPAPEPGDIVVVASKVVSRAEHRFVDLATVVPSLEAHRLAEEIGATPELVEVVLGDTERVSRYAKGALIVRHRLGIVSANACVDRSNAGRPPGAAEGTGPWVLRLPEDPDASAARLRHGLETRLGLPLAVLMTDSLGRPFRQGSVGAAVGLSGLAPLRDRRGDPDLTGYLLEHTETALADQVAAAADLVMGQADEARPVIIVRGVRSVPAASAEGARALVRPVDEDLYL
jgi:coenzyme F420-0:L-glutamate ligase/coenzyme F420-1:gamma-L-glutamate ligase